MNKMLDKHLQVASIVKLMTTLLTIEEIEKRNIYSPIKLLQLKILQAWEAHKFFIDPFIEYTVEDMLRSVIIASANDASVALAEYIAGQ